MKRSLYIFAALAILTGCNEFKDTNGTLPESVKESVEAGGTDTPAKPAEAPVTPAAAEPQSGVKSIAGKPESDVTALLGKPTATETGEWTSLSTEEKTPFVRHTYKADIGEISVMFIEGVAARIEAKLVETLKYPDDAIKAIRAVGLAVEDGATPERENPLYLDYGQVDGFYNVRVVKDVEGNPENVAYVKLVTESRFK
jgi:Prokaryotic membrane lipoprotein lipid attachment site